MTKRMKTQYPPKLARWLFFWSFLFFFLCFLLSQLIFSFFFKEISAHFIVGFIAGFVISVFISSFFYLYILRLLGKLVKKTKAIIRGDMSLKYEDSFINEAGEFYDLYRSLNKINNTLRWQKEIISQESSELEAVISAVRGAILAVDSSKKILFYNQQVTMLFQSHPQANRKNLFLSELIRNPDILQCYDQCLKTGKNVTKKIEVSLINTEKEIIYEVSVAPLKAEDKSIQGAVGLFYDITGIKKTERLHLDFISNVSHELRTPLTAIQGYVQTLLSEIKNNKIDEAKKFLQIINRNVERLVSLLNHFLELSQLESSFDIKKEEVSTKNITESIVKDLHIKDHKLKFDFSAKEVQADRHFLKQVLYNLLDNAIRYVPKGRLIEVLWKREEDTVILTVRDHGEGIDPRHRERIFEKFYRVDAARTKTSKGVSGIGLSIVKELMEKHGGSITLKSKESEGTQFVCTFPDDSL